MKHVRVILVFIIVLVGATALLAEGPVGVYATVQKVVFEPNEQAPTKIQVWGLFVWVDGGLDKPGPINLPQKGYMYFKLPANASQAAAAKKQWAEIKSLAGTPQIIAFGGWNAAGPFEDLYIPVAGEDVRVRKQTETPAKPITYPIKPGMPGLMKIANDAQHADLNNLMKAFALR